MERLNKSGRALLEYRNEYKKHYSDSIDESLKEAISIMYNERKIDEKVFKSIFNESISDDDFEIILSKKKEFTKNTAELNYEFDLVRRKINEYMIEIGFINSMNTKNSLDINKIIIIHQFDLNRNYIMSSFGVNQTEIIPLMKRRGFVEKFAVLRLNQVLKEIYGEMRMPEDIDHGYSLVYYNKKTQSFSIDYKFYINVDVASDEKRMKSLLDKIKELDKIIDKKFHNKLGNSYFSEPKNNENELKMKNAEKPIVKQSPIESAKTVVEKATKTEKQEQPKEIKEPVKNPPKEQPKQKEPEKKQDNTPKVPSNMFILEDTDVPPIKNNQKNQPPKNNQPKDNPPKDGKSDGDNKKTGDDKKDKKNSFDEIEIEFDVSDKDLL